MSINNRRNHRPVFPVVWLMVLALLAIPGSVHAFGPANDQSLAQVVNNPPTFTAGANPTVNEDSGAVSIADWATDISPGLSGDTTEYAQTVSFNVTVTSNPGLFTAAPTIAPVTTNSYPAMRALTFTLAPNTFGSATATVTAQDDLGATSPVHNLTITVDPVNYPPSFTAGANPTVNEDSGAVSIAGWAAGISPGLSGDITEYAQTVSFNVTVTSNPGLFTVAPDIASVAANSYPATRALTFTLAPNTFGSATATVTAQDNLGATSPVHNLTITVDPVNYPPSFTAGANPTVNEDSGAASIAGWATNILPGDATEYAQTVSFNVAVTSNPGLFTVAPAIASVAANSYPATRALTFTPAPNAFGSATATVVAQDNLGATSSVHNLTITVNPVNDPPSFIAGGNQRVAMNSGPASVPNWATDIYPGPANEYDQTVNFNVTANTNPSLFSAGPAVASAGLGGYPAASALTFTPAPNQYGSARISVAAKDNGGPPGVDVSASQNFTITVTSTDLTLTKIAAGATTLPGSLITYQLDYANNGNMTAASVSISETVPAGVTFDATNSTAGWSCADAAPAGSPCQYNIATLGQGATGSANFAVRVDNPIDGNIVAIRNTAEIRSPNNDDRNNSNNRASAVTPLTVSVVPTVKKSGALLVDADLDEVPSPGDTLRYTVVIVANGDASAIAAVLTDTLDPNTQLDVGSVVTTAGTVTSGNGSGDTSVEVNIGDMAVGATVTVTYDALIRNPLPQGVTEIVNQAFVQGTNFAVPSDDPSQPGEADKTVLPLFATPILVAQKIDGLYTDADNNEVASPGDTLAYTVTVSNIGNQETTGVVLNDQVDSNAALDVGSVTTDCGFVAIGNTAGDTAVRVNFGTLSGGGASCTITFRVLINDFIPAETKDILNQAVITSDQLPEGVLSDDPDFPGNQDPTRTNISADANLYASLSSYLIDDSNGNGQADVGEVLLFVAEIVNNGRRSADGVMYTDPLDPNLSLIDWVLHAGNGEITAGDIATGDSLEVPVGELLGNGGEKKISYHVHIVGVTGLSAPPDSDEDDAWLLLSQGLVTYIDPVSGELVEVWTNIVSTIIHGVQTINLHMPLIYR